MRGILFFTLGFSFALLVACREDLPKWYGKIFISDPSIGGIVYNANGENKTIDCRSSDFSGYLCMSDSDFKSFYETYIVKCTGWDKKNQLDKDLKGSTNP